jgi:hypothetical protein
MPDLFRRYAADDGGGWDVAGDDRVRDDHHAVAD